MGKNKDGARFVNKEIFQRVNFLYQAAQLAFRQDPTNHDMCRYYISTMRMVAEKHVIRIHPKMKRTICKCCNMLLVPGRTSRIRFRSKSETHTVVTCLLCGTIKRFMWRKSHQLWMDKPEAWLNAGAKPGKTS
ncbi:unnamed protein product [Candidula unifasciata]|uniref:Uncharacterized protein n=1 Tax=Candidula unifasciata TaxID=100452 RepID=A0A8S3ZQ72_9EUPU|nr:unnamed protein product [Candidula unifasciata]